MKKISSTAKVHSIITFVCLGTGDYPWIIPFGMEITGIPLHLWTIKNLRNIGNRLGHINTVDLSTGRMLIDVDTRKPHTFTRKIASREGDEVSIQINYDKLFKHCKTCGMVTHELVYCCLKSLCSENRENELGSLPVFSFLCLMNLDSHCCMIRSHKTGVFIMVPISITIEVEKV